MTINEMNLNNVNGGAAEEQPTPGFKCPRCNGLIATNIYEIIKGNPVICTHCGLKLEVEKSRSTAAIEALRKVKEAQDRLEREGK